MTRAPADPVIGQCRYVDGSTRTVYAEGGRQYVLDENGRPVYGVWLRPAEEPETAIIVIEAGAQP
jgi:hypothetical protein